MTEPWSASTILFVSDAGAAADFYADKLGFTVNWRSDDDGRTVAAGVSRDNCSLLLNTQRADSVGKGAIYLGFDEIEYDALRAACLAKEVALKEGWWGKRLMIVADPDGNELWFADPRDHG